MKLFVAGGILLLLALGLCFALLVGRNFFSPHSEISQKEALLTLIAQEKKAHLDKNATLLVSGFSPDFKTISNGVLSRPPQKESITKFSAYFNRADILKWDDEQAPVITFSADSSMAYVIVQKEVQTKYKADNKIDDTIAWVSVYKQFNNIWKLDCIVSTNKPTDK